MDNPIAVLITGYEVAPFYKKGGLGDVIGSLPIALRKENVDARVVMPFYHQVRKHYPQKKIGDIPIRFGSEDRIIKLYQGVFPDGKTPIYFLENQKYINLASSKVKKLEQFVFFDLAVCYFVNWLTQRNIWQPKLIHCNDWHTALIPLILKNKMQSSMKTLLTIHNLLYQGNGSPRVLDLLSIKDEDTREIKRGGAVTEMSILGEGILHASRVSTVSKTYAKEISDKSETSPIYHYIQRRLAEWGKEGEVIGILNGIDYQIWNPSKDHILSQNYDTSNITLGKQKNKESLLLELKLEDRPTFSFVGRMAAQKGLDLIIDAAESIMALDVNLIILGEGHRTIEKKVEQMAKKYPNRLRAVLLYNEDLAHKLFAGSDFLLIPSHYEPCGLIQMMAMRYGTIPIASETGGLIDSIKDGQTGFLFKMGSTADFITAIRRALRMHEDKKRFHAMRHLAMQEDFSWDKSAKQYRNLYMEIIREEVNSKA